MGVDATPSVTAPWLDDAQAAPPPTGSFGRYRIERALGAGGMGVVVAAHDPDLGRMVAIKFLQRAEPAAQERLITEARAMARLSHPNVVAVHEVLRIGDRAGIVMELIEGPDLGRWLARAPQPWTAIVAAYVQAAHGLAAAHRAGLVHRDFKPANALIDAAGIVRVTDFGLARTVDDAEPSSGGTPAYMAPEQRLGAPVDDRTDQWAFGFALRRALDGAHRAGRPAPAYIARALVRATATEPGDRFPDLGALIAALAPRRRRRWAYFGAGALGAAAVAGVMLVAWPRRAAPPPSCAALAEAELAPSWSPIARDALTAVFAPRGAAAASTWARTATALDAHARVWRDARVAACTADRTQAIAPALSDLRSVCLDRRRGELTALVVALGAPDAETVALAHPSSLELADPALCLDLAGLTRREPIPDAAPRRPAIAAARARLDAAHAAAALGQLPAARRQLDELLAQARVDGWAPLVAEVLVEAGLVAAIDRDFAAADRLLDEGVLVAEAAGYDRATVRGLIGLVDVRGRGLVRFDDALALVPRTQAVLARLGGDTALTATLDAARGSVYWLQGKYTDALAVYTAVLAARRALDPRHPDVATSEIDVGDALQKLGRSTEALPHYHAALALREELFGPAHVLVARATYSVGNGLLELHDHAGAIAAYQQTLVAYEASYGPHHPILASALNNLAFAHILAGQPAEALPLLERGLAIANASDHEPINLALLEGNLGDALRRLGRLAEAGPYLERSLANFRAAYGASNPHLIGALVDLAALEIERGDRAAARAHLAEAQQLCASLGPDHPLTVEVGAQLAAATRGPRSGAR